MYLLATMKRYLLYAVVAERAHQRACAMHLFVNNVLLCNIRVSDQTKNLSFSALKQLGLDIFRCTLLLFPGHKQPSNLNKPYRRYNVPSILGGLFFFILTGIMLLFRGSFWAPLN